MKTAAAYLSAIFIPLLAPTYLFVVVFVFFPGMAPYHLLGEQVNFVLLLFAATCLPPFVLVYLLYKLKYISSLTLEKRKDRFIPQILGLFDYILISVLLSHFIGVSNILTLCMVATTISLFCIMLITHFWKISTHAAGIWGMLGIVSILCLKNPNDHHYSIWIAMMVFAVAVSLARLYLKVHTRAQVIAGALLGLGCASIILVFLPR